MKSLVPTKSARLQKGAVILAAVITMALGGAYLVLVQPGPDGVLARATLPDGTECLVTQSWNGWDNGGEPYTVSFYSKKPGGPWLWQYLDHESRRWTDCEIRQESGSRAVKVFSDGELRGDLDLDWPYQHEQDPPIRFWKS